MSSMTDLVFLLLLFFVMASTMSSPNDIKINLPTSRAQKVTRPQVAKVSIDNFGNYFVALGKEKPVADRSGESGGLPQWYPGVGLHDVYRAACR